MYVCDVCTHTHTRISMYACMCATCVHIHIHTYMVYLFFLAAARDADAAMLPVASARNVNKPGTSKLLRVRIGLCYVCVYVCMYM
jgi:hypothetical protein